jgi:hypothetical protein
MFDLLGILELTVFKLLGAEIVPEAQNKMQPALLLQRIQEQGALAGVHQ